MRHRHDRVDLRAYRANRAGGSRGDLSPDVPQALIDGVGEGRDMDRTRRALLGGVAVSAIGAVMPAAGGASGSTGRWSSTPPPVAPLVPHRITQLGRTRDDPYAWMKYVPKQGTRDLATMPPTISRHLRAEQAYADAMLRPLEAHRDRLLRAMLERVGEAAAEPALVIGSWLYRSHIAAGRAHPVHVRQLASGGPEELLLDEAARAAGHPYYRSTDHQPSPDGRYFAWAEDVIGNDRHRLCVRDNATGRVSVVVPADAYPPPS